MARIDEQRRILEAKLKEMAEDGVVKCAPRATITYDPPDEDEEETATALTPAHEERSTAKETRQEKTLETRHGVSCTSLDDYRSLYLQQLRIREKTAFTMNVETLQILRNVLQDLGERVSMVSYIDNILREHLKEYRELINNATAKQRRKTTITI